MKNLALNKPARQSSTSTWSRHRDVSEDARGANNGAPAEFGFHTEQEREPWWQVDLGDGYAISRIILYNRPDVPNRLSRFSVLTSLDERSWNEAYRKVDGSIFGDKLGEPFIVDFTEPRLGRYVRIRLDGFNYLHFNECEVFGSLPDAALRRRLIERDATRERESASAPKGRIGHMTQVGGFNVFVDTEHYHPAVIEALDGGGYEHRERHLVSECVRAGDRVIEAGTAAGIVAMTAASIVGAQNVWTYEANPDIALDAQANFARNEMRAITSHVGILKNRRAMKGPGEMVPFYIDQIFVASRLNASENAPGIVKTVQIPVFCLEDAIAAHKANVIICDIEGGEVELLRDADLSTIRLILMETHYWAAGEVATDAMISKLIADGFSLHLGYSGDHVIVLRRHPRPS